MTYTLKEFDAKTDRKYLPQMRALADDGLSKGFLSDEEVGQFGKDEYFCAFGVDENDRVCCMNFGKYADIETVAGELRCSADEVRALLPEAKKFAVHLGLVVADGAQGNGLATKIMRFHHKIIFQRADVIIKGVWMRDGEEKPVIRLLDNLGAVFIKKVPRYWYGYTDLYCSRCKGRCICDCDLYYLTKDGLKP